MASVNDDLLDSVVRHQVGVNRYSTATVLKIVKLLNKADADIAAQIMRFEPGSRAKKRLERMLDAIRTVNQEAYSVATGALGKELSAFAGYEGEFLVRALQTALPVEMNVVSPTAEQLYAAVNARPFQGRFLKDWGQDLEANAFARVRDAIRMGFVEGQTTEQIVRRIRGTRSNRYSDGILEINRRSAEMVVRTAISHTSNVARQETYAANSDVVAEWRFVATLDNRTSLICINLDGQTFPLGKGPQPPRHPNCRSTTVPVTKSWRELGFDIDELPPGTRASMDGQVPANLTYKDWLKKQSHDVVEDVLGPERAALYRTGGLDVDRFVDTTGKTYTLAQLRQRDNEAFEKAGLNNPIRPPRGQPQDEIAIFLDDKEAQRSLLQQAMGQLDYHMQAVQRAIENEGWTATVEPLLGIRHYTGSAYMHLNSRMRNGGQTLDDRKITALIDKGIYELPLYRDDIWRAPAKSASSGDMLWERAVPGEMMDLGNQLQSFSREQSIAQSWSNDAYLIYHIRNPMAGAYVEKISQNPGEEEVLLPAGLRYKVVAKRMEGPMRVIELEIVE